MRNGLLPLKIRQSYRSRVWKIWCVWRQNLPIWKEPGDYRPDLIRTALRMAPDRIIVGEIRGEEAVDLLQAFICTI